MNTDGYRLHAGASGEPGDATLVGAIANARLARAPAALREETRALPRVEDACGHARRCAREVERMSGGAADAGADAGRTAGPFPGDLLGCQVEEKRVRALVPKPPFECQ
jgi:hypothetical protein